MQMKKYVSRFCVLLFLIIEDANVNGEVFQFIQFKQPRWGRTKDYNIGICLFSAKHAALRRKSKDWLARNRDNVSEWGDMSIRGLLLQ
jgi:hypothetical protein